MRFTREQYDEAIANLEFGKQQLEPDGNYCAIFGDGGHQAWECAWNPLRAMWAARETHRAAHALHDALHAMCGFYSPAINSPALAAIVPEGGNAPLRPDCCEHGVPDTGYCEDCRAAYRAAEVDPENGLVDQC